jgi:hypothetical protein
MGIRTTFTRGSAAIASLRNGSRRRPRRPRARSATTAALERVVQQDQAARPQPGQHLFVVPGVAGLVGIDEREVELLAGGSDAEGLQARADPQLDPVGDPGFLPRRAGD